MQNNEKDVPMVPKFWAENTCMHMENENRRMLIALVTVCATAIIVIGIFVAGYTMRTKNWLETIEKISKPPVTEVDNGRLLQQPDESSHP